LPGQRIDQIAAGNIWAIARWSDGSVTTWGLNPFWAGDVPHPNRGRTIALPADRFVGASIGYSHCTTLRADGSSDELPAPPRGLRYQKVLAHQDGSLALRSDGQILTFGSNPGGMWTAPPLPAGVTYTDVAGKIGHFVALRSDGTAVAFGANTMGQCNLPALPPGITYTQASAHYFGSLLLRSDGVIVHAGDTSYGQHLIPACPPGVHYTTLSRAFSRALATRSDGAPVVWGGNPVMPPPQPWGTYFVQAIGGDNHGWFRRSDGEVFFVAQTLLLTYPRYRPPALDPGSSYLDVDAFLDTAIARVGPTTIYVGHIPGCAGSRPTSRLVPNETPRIGQTLRVRLFDLPVNIAVMALGWQATTPLDLGALGMPGCQLGITIDGVVALAGNNHQAVWSLPIPDQPALVGTHFYNQALVLDPAAGNSFGAVLSDAMRGVVGYP
jgi:hypothetical protein